MSERNARPSGDSETAIVRAAIYPAIGIARLGNSENEYFLAPNKRASAAPCPRAPPLMSMIFPLRQSILSSIWLPRALSD